MVCMAARADAAFAAFGFVMWSGTVAILGLEMFRSGFKGLGATKTDRNAERAMKEGAGVGA